MQNAAVENAKTYPTCWQTKKSNPGGVDDRRTATVSGFSSRSATSSSRTSRSAFNSVSNPDCSVSGSPQQTKTGSVSCVGVSESKTSQGTPVISPRKIQLDDYRRRLTKPSVVLTNHHTGSPAAANGEQNRRSESRLLAESTRDVVRSPSNVSGTHRSGSKPRIKLEIGSKVVANSVSDAKQQAGDTSGVQQNVVCNGHSSSEHCSDGAEKAGVSRNVFEQLKFSDIVPSTENAGRAWSSSSCEEDGGDSEPPSKRARLSSSHQSSPVADSSYCKWIHHD